LFLSPSSAPGGKARRTSSAAKVCTRTRITYSHRIQPIARHRCLHVGSLEIAQQTSWAYRHKSGLRLSFKAGRTPFPISG
jgi:hypothetical protein